MSVYREQVAAALRAVRVTSPTRFAWFGNPSPALARAVRDELSPAAARAFLVRRLTQELYGSFYLRGAPRPQVQHDDGGGGDAAFVAALSAANAGSGGWGREWRVVEVAAGGEVVAERDGLRLRAGAADYRALGQGPPAPGSSIRTRRPKGLPAASPGFYLAHGDADARPEPAAVEVRVYFNVTAAGAVALLSAATRLLNEEEVAFALKLVDHPARYSRCDSAVLYLQDGDFARARAPLRALVDACAPHLRRATPALTKALAPGVGVGENRSAVGASFGLGRCRLLGEAIADAHEQGLRALGDRIAAVARRFELAGLDLDVAHLSSNARDDYDL